MKNKMKARLYIIKYYFTTIFENYNTVPTICFFFITIQANWNWPLGGWSCSRVL